MEPFKRTHAKKYKEAKLKQKKEAEDKARESLSAAQKALGVKDGDPRNYVTSDQETAASAADAREGSLSTLLKEVAPTKHTQEEIDKALERVDEDVRPAVRKLYEVADGAISRSKVGHKGPKSLADGLGAINVEVGDDGKPIINVRVYKAEPTDKERKNMEDAKDTKKYMLQQLGGYQMTPEISGMVDAGIDSESIIRLMRKLTRRRLRMGHAVKRSSEIDMVRSMDEKAIAERHKR